MITELPDNYPLLTDKKFTMIHKVGLELEGGWGSRPENYRIHTDGSVHCRGEVRGESRTEPRDNMKDIFTEINMRYPDDIDQTCGMHIHTSVKPGLYHLMTSKDFHDYFLYRMGVLGKYLRNVGHEVDYKRFLVRLNGSNQYCMRDFIPMDQLKRNGNRRTMINFACYQKHGTFECRLLPMFEQMSNARMATREYISCVETYLANKKLAEPICVTICNDVEAEQEATCAS